MSVPFVDLKAQYRSIRAEIDAAVAGVLEDATFIGGERVARFEAEWARALGVPSSLACGNGTDALYVAFRMLGIGPGDEVIVPAVSWFATSETVGQTGARPVFVDVEAATRCIDPALVERAVTPRTRAIVPVHLYGHPADMTPLLDVARRRGLFVVEDTAQSHLATDRGRVCGTMGDVGTFSFFPGKNLGAYGDAGAIVARDPALLTRMRRFARHGALEKHDHEIEGINSRLDALQAAVLSAKLPHLARWTDARVRNARLYDERLRGVAERTGMVLPVVRDGCRHVFHLYVVATRGRDALRAGLAAKGIATGVHYPQALPFLPAYRGLGHIAADFPVAARLSDEILSLPMFPELTAAQIDEVGSAIESHFAQRG